ncbi:MAG: hypothetical protein LBM00_09520 [Deltaproteobacteria bacterium]|jgi:uncharacterized membrane protein YkvI|nr:hypothetical protein [Deltaproteobacteria bacterium]
MEGNGNKNLSLATLFSIACVWFGSHVGGGFATGNQTWQYYASWGWISIITPVLSMGLLALVLRQAVVFAQAHQAYAYDEFFKKLWAPYPKLELIFEVYFVIILLVAVGVAIAGAASLFVEYIPYTAAAVLTGLILFFTTIFGANVMRRAATFMCIIILLACALIFGIGIAAQSANIAPVLTETELPSGAWPPLYRIFVYAGFQAVVLPAFIACTREVKTAKSANTVTFLGFLMNGGYLTLGVLLLLIWQGQGGINFAAITLPNLEICNALGGGWLYWCYFVTLFLAFISTGVSCIFGMVARLENKIFTKSAGLFANITMRRALISALVMLASVSLSLFGLTALVRYGYGLCGYIGIFAVILPILIIGTVKINRYKKEHPEFMR